MAAGVSGTKKRSLEVIPNTDPNDETCATFVLHEEDHTLGNSLRYMIMKNPDVTYCGYTVPHPSENKLNLRIQTNGAPASDILRQGLCELTAACEHALALFETAVEEYKSTHTENDDDDDDFDDDDANMSSASE